MIGTVSSPEQNEDATVISAAVREDLVDWWGETVALTFFPTLSSGIMSLFRFGFVDMKRLIGDGELVLCSFLIITPSIMHLFKEKSLHIDKNSRGFFYSLLFVAFLQLVTYTSIKTSSTKTVIVYATSLICVISSVALAWMSEKMLLRRRQ